MQDEKKVLVIVDSQPKFNIGIEKSTTISSLKSLLMANQIINLKPIKNKTIKMYINPKTELKIFASKKYDDMTLESAWDQVKSAVITIDSGINKKIFLIHDNGGRPFKVDINGTKVTIFTEDGKLLKTLTSNKVFIGKSPYNKMTEFSGGFGEEFDGNTILVEISPKLYVYIGESIYEFQSIGEIQEYVSPVGNNDVPYPYAIDEFGNYYLFSEKTILDKKYAKDILKNDGDPYTYMYHVNPSVPIKKLIVTKTYAERIF